MDCKDNIEELLASSVQPHPRPFLRERRLKVGRARDSQHSTEPFRGSGSGSYSSHLRRRRDAIIQELDVFTHLSLAKIKKYKKAKEAEIAFRQFEERSQQLAAQTPLFVHKKSPVALRQTNLIKGAQGMLKPYNESKFYKLNNLLAQTTQNTSTQLPSEAEEKRMAQSGRPRMSDSKGFEEDRDVQGQYGLDVRKMDFTCKTDQTLSKSFMESTSIASRRLSGQDKNNKTIIKIKTSTKFKSRSEKSHKINVSAYDIRLANYKEFIFTLYYCNSVYVDTIFPVRLDASEAKVDVFVGSGNNSALVKRILKKRWWLHISEAVTHSTMFIWTQIKNRGFVLSQKSSMPYAINQKLMNKQKQKSISPNSPFTRIVHECDQPNLPICELTKRTQRLRVLNPIQRVHNHLQFAGYIGNKKSLLKCMQCFYEFHSIPTNQYNIPLTYHISSQADMKLFSEEFKSRQSGKNNTWIVKPGENSNRGRGIIVSGSLQEISDKVRPKKRTHVIQEYLSNLLLYQRRKFDIRAYCLVTQVCGVMRAYWYEEGYIRTSSEPFTTNALAEPMVHLTNDAVQKHGPNYGKYQAANKVSYSQLDQYLKSAGLSNQVKKMDQLVADMKKVTTDVIKSSYCLLDPNCRQNNFQLFGIDFLIDQSFKVWLLQVNTNPCLQLCCPLLQHLIPRMLDNALTIALDPLIPIPNTNSKQYFPDTNINSNRFELIFDSQFDRDLAYEAFLKPRMVDRPPEEQFADAA